MLLCEEYSWLPIAGACMAFLVAFGYGAHSLGSAFAAPVGSRVLQTWQADIIAAICLAWPTYWILSSWNEWSTEVADVGLEQARFHLLEGEAWGVVSYLGAAGIWAIITAYMEMPILMWPALKSAWDGVEWASSDETEIAGFQGRLSTMLSLVAVLLGTVLTSATFLIVLESFLRARSLHVKPLVVLNVIFAAIGAFIVEHVIWLQVRWSRLRMRVIVIVAAMVCQLLIVGVSQWIHVRICRHILEDPNASLDGVYVPRNVATQQLESNRPQGRGQPAEGDTVAVGAVTADSVDSQEGETVEAPKQGGTTSQAGTEAFGSRSLRWLASLRTDVHEVLNFDRETHDVHANAERYSMAMEQLFAPWQVVLCAIQCLFQASVDLHHGLLLVFHELVLLWLFLQPEAADVSAERAGAPYWLLIVVAAGLILGLSLAVQPLIRTVGVRIAKISAARGVCCQVGTLAAFLVTLQLGKIHSAEGDAWRFGEPGTSLSGTYVQAFGVVALGLFERNKGVNWTTVKRICIAAIATMFVPGCISALLTAAGRAFIIPCELHALRDALSSAPAPAPFALGPLDADGPNDTSPISAPSIDVIDTRGIAGSCYAADAGLEVFTVPWPPMVAVGATAAAALYAQFCQGSRLEPVVADGQTPEGWGHFAVQTCRIVHTLVWIFFAIFTGSMAVLNTRQAGCKHWVTFATLCAAAGLVLLLLAVATLPKMLRLKVLLKPHFGGPEETEEEKLRRKTVTLYLEDITGVTTKRCSEAVGGPVHDVRIFSLADMEIQESGWLLNAMALILVKAFATLVCNAGLGCSIIFFSVAYTTGEYQGWSRAGDAPAIGFIESVQAAPRVAIAIAAELFALFVIAIVELFGLGDRLVCVEETTGTARGALLKPKDARTCGGAWSLVPLASHLAAQVVLVTATGELVSDFSTAEVVMVWSVMFTGAMASIFIGESVWRRVHSARFEENLEMLQAADGVDDDTDEIDEDGSDAVQGDSTPKTHWWPGAGPAGASPPPRLQPAGNGNKSEPAPDAAASASPKPSPKPSPAPSLRYSPSGVLRSRNRSMSSNWSFEISLPFPPTGMKR